MKLLVRATNWVGDAVMALPALRAIRESRLRDEIVLAARPWVADLYAGQGCADRVVKLEGGNEGRLASGLHSERFDQALLLPNSFAAAWFAWRAGARERIGYARDARSALLTRPIAVPRPGETPAHESFYYLELIRRARWIDALPEVKEIRLQVDSVAAERARSRLAEAGAPAGKKKIALATGAAYGSAKCWPPERYAELADRLIARFDAGVILFGTARERDTCEQILRGMHARAIDLAGQTPIGELPALMSACDLFIGNDSGAMHVAAAVGLPVVAIFGPTDPDATAPVTPRKTLVREPVSCSPCFLRHCPVDHRCMTRIGVDEVFRAACGWLEGGARG